MLYVGVAIVLLGMMKYTTFVSGAAAEAPVAYALQAAGSAALVYRSMIVIGALMGMISSLLVFQYGQARIWYAMSREACFLSYSQRSIRNSRLRTGPPGSHVLPSVFPQALVDIGDAADLSNIGTLFAFVLVSLGVILLRRRSPTVRALSGAFVPWFPLISIVLCGGLMTGPDRDHLDPLRGVAGIGLVHLLLLQPPSQRVLPT